MVADVGPHDWREIHSLANRAHTITGAKNQNFKQPRNTCDSLNVTIRGTHCVRSQTGDILDSFFGPAELSNNFFVGHC